MNRASLLLFLTIFLEGYAVLSTELLAIRQVMPFVGSATDVIAIIIAAVLLPLAFGYAAGGNFNAGRKRKGAARERIETVRGRLLGNLALAALILAVGMSYAASHFFFFTAADFGLRNKQLTSALYALVFVAGPVFLMGQTVPLISHYFRRRHLSRFAGQVLFYSTTGSFAGSVLCTLVLMPDIGLSNTSVLTVLCLTLLVCLLSRRALTRPVVAAVAALFTSILLNSAPVLRHYNIVLDDQYMTVQVIDPPAKPFRMMQINGTLASAVMKDPAANTGNIFPHLAYIEDTFIKSRAPSDRPLDILVIGSGGFTLGLNDVKNHYVFIDIDPDLQDVAETYFLKQKLGANKIFVPQEARAYLAGTKKMFDLVVLDPYQDSSGIPLGLVTTQFFAEIAHILKPGGAMTGNFYVSANFNDAFSIRLDNTIRSVFPNLNRQIVWPYDGWMRAQPQYINAVYTGFKDTKKITGVYTDDLNRSFLDKNKLNR